LLEISYLFLLGLTFAAIKNANNDAAQKIYAYHNIQQILAFEGIKTERVRLI
jgi:hypothetical protein